MFVVHGSSRWNTFLQQIFRYPCDLAAIMPANGFINDTVELVLIQKAVLIDLEK